MRNTASTTLMLIIMKDTIEMGLSIKGKEKQKIGKDQDVVIDPETKIPNDIYLDETHRGDACFEIRSIQESMV